MENDRHYAIRGGETSVPLLCAGVGSCGNQSALSRQWAASVEPRRATDGLQGLCHEPSLTAMETFPGGVVWREFIAFTLFQNETAIQTTLRINMLQEAKRKKNHGKSILCTCVHVRVHRRALCSFLPFMSLFGVPYWGSVS